MWQKIMSNYFDETIAVTFQEVINTQLKVCIIILHYY